MTVGKEKLPTPVDWWWLTYFRTNKRRLDISIHDREIIAKADVSFPVGTWRSILSEKDNKNSEDATYKSGDKGTNWKD